MRLWIKLAVLAGVYLTVDYLQDGAIDGSFLVTMASLHIPIIPIFGLTKTVAGVTIRTKKVFHAQDGTYEIDMRATMKRLGKRKDHHHKHEGS